MRVERDGLIVGYDPKSTGIYIGDLMLDADAARWLALVALPAALVAVPSDGREKVEKSEPDAGQIPGQLAIE